MSYSLVKGNLDPDMLITLTAPGAKAALATALAISMVWTKPDNTTVTVPLLLVDAPTWRVKRVWATGDSDLVGVHYGRVVITDAAGKTTDDPIDSTSLIWWVFPELGT